MNRFRLFKSALLVSASLWVLAPYSHAASFDCAKATTAIDRAICASPVLSDLDDRLAKAYTDSQLRATDQPARAAIKAEQLTWLRQTRNSCPDDICLAEAYQSRIQALQKGLHQDVAEPASSAASATTELGPASAPETLKLPTGQDSPEAAAAVVEAPASDATNVAPSIPYPNGSTGTTQVPVQIEDTGASSGRSDVQPSSIDRMGGALLLATVAAVVMILFWRFRSGRLIGRILSQYRELYLREKIAFIAIPILLVVALPLGILYAVVYLWRGRSRRCPSCGTLYARTLIDSESLGIESGYETVTRRDEIRVRTSDTFENFAFGGKHVGNVIRQEQVHVTYEQERVYFECCCCSHRWSEVWTSKA